MQPPGGGPPDIDIKKYAKVEKLPGGSLEDCRVLSGVMFQKVFIPKQALCHHDWALCSLSGMPKGSSKGVPMATMQKVVTPQGR